MLTDKEKIVAGFAFASAVDGKTFDQMIDALENAENRGILNPPIAKKIVETSRNNA